MRRLLICALLASLVVSPRAIAAEDRLFEISEMLGGTFDGSTPGNQLRLNLSTLAIDPTHPFDLFLAVSGRFEKDNVRQQGVIRLERQGTDIYFTYIPHFDASITALSADAGRFTERELSSACSFVMKPVGDGFAGDTLGSTACSLAMRGANGKWSVELEPGSIRVRNTTSGETLRFKQAVSAPKKS